MPRGRPRKVALEPTKENRTIQEIIADVLHDKCDIPGCTTKIHLWEASDVMDALKDEGFEIRKCVS